MMDSELKPGQLVLNKYRIVRPLAKGGMGMIYLARSEGAAGFVRPFVVKRILREFVGDDSMEKMFAREARIMAQLHHPGVVSVVDFEEEDSAYVMVLEYVHGLTLGRWLKFMRMTQRQFPVEVAIQVTTLVLDALHYAHTLTDARGQLLNIIHRDVTPSNVLISIEGHVKLADFGIARMNADATEAGEGKTLKGKFAYLSPEMFLGGEASPATDAYACAVVLHELLTGKNFFAAPDAQGTISKVLHETPPRVDQLRPDVPSVLGAVLNRALIKVPSERYASADALAADLRMVRTMPADDAQQALAKQVEQDFADKRIAELLQMPSLAELESAWRDFRADEHTQPSRSHQRRQPVTKPQSGLATSAKIWIALGVSVSLVLSVAAALVVLSRPEQSAPAPVLVLESPEEPTEAPAVLPQAQPPAPVETADPVNQAPETKPVTKPPQPVARNKPTADPFSKALAHFEPKFSKCFEAHAQNNQVSRVDLRFSLAQSGSVDEVSVMDAEIKGSELARCLESIAKQAIFPKQEAPVAFRIPISARRSQ